MKLFEVFDAPYPWKYEYLDRTSNWLTETQATFKGQAGTYTVNIHGEEQHASYEVDFTLGGKSEEEAYHIHPTGTGSTRAGGDAFKVYATVIDILKDYADRKPNKHDLHFWFDATEPSRVKLHRRFLKYFGQKYGWYTEEQIGQRFVIQRPD